MSFFTALIGSKAAMGVLAIGVAAIGGTAAVSYASTLPESSQQATSHVSSVTAGAQTDATDAPHSTPTSKPTAKAIGPDAAGPAAFGLCTAFTHGGLGTKSTAYASLVTAAAGADKLAAYCATVITAGKAGSHHADSADVSEPSDSEGTDSEGTDSDGSDAPATPVHPTHAADDAAHKKAVRP